MNNQEQIVENALNLFWARGAETATYDEIVKATGLSRKSLYGHWPDKNALIEDTLDIYYQKLLDFIAILKDPGGLSGLNNFWDSFETIAQQKDWRGCYLYKTANGPLRGALHIKSLYQLYIIEFSNAIADQIRQGQANGEIDKEIDADIAGLICFSLMGTISSIGAQSGFNSSVKQLLDVARKVCGVANNIILGP